MPLSDAAVSALLIQIANLEARLVVVEDAQNDMLSRRSSTGATASRSWGSGSAADTTVAAFLEAVAREHEDGEPWWPAASIHAEYASWCKTVRMRSLAANLFAVRMRELGHVSKKTSRGTVYPLARRR